MNEIKIYLSGKIAGLALQEAQRKFQEAEDKVRKLYGGEKVVFVNPMKLPAVQSSWADYIIRDLMLLKECDVIFMLPDWTDSPGAKVEREFAKGLGRAIVELQ